MEYIQLCSSFTWKYQSFSFSRTYKFCWVFWQNKGKANKHEIWGIANKRFDDFRRKLWYLKFFPKNAHYFTIQGLSNVRYRHIKEKGFTGGIAVCSCFSNTPINFIWLI